MYKPTKTQFINWLKSKKPRQNVGNAADYHECPIACFATEAQSDVEYATVGGFLCLYSTDLPSMIYELPQWARNFVRAVDKLGDGASVTAKQALTIMETV